MKKILLLLMVLLSLLQAERGFEQGKAKNEVRACDEARQQAHKKYRVFQMNSSCTCTQKETQEWLCDLSFSYMSKEERIKNSQ